MESTTLTSFLAEPGISSKEDMKSLVLEIHGYLSSSFAASADLDLMSKIIASLGFGLCLMDNGDNRDLNMIILKSILLIAKKTDFQHLVVQNVLIVAHLLSSTTLLYFRKSDSEILSIYLEIWSFLTPYHGQLTKLATPAFLLQFQEVTLQLVEKEEEDEHVLAQQPDSVSSAEPRERSIASLMMQILFSIVSNCSMSSLAATLSNNSHFHSRLLNLISHHPNLHTNSCALGILSCILHDQPELKAQVFCKDNLTEIGGLVVNLFIHQTHSRHFRDLMMGTVYGLEAEGLCGLEIVEGMAAKALAFLESEKSQIGRIIELVVAFSKTRLPQNHALFSLTLFTNPDEYSSFCSTHKTGWSKLDIVEYFKAHATNILYLDREKNEKRDIFAKAWLGILQNELAASLAILNQVENAKKIDSDVAVAFLHASLAFMDHDLLQWKDSQVQDLEQILVQLVAHPLSQNLFTPSHIIALVLVMEELTLGLEDGHSVYKSLSPRFPQLFQECTKSGCLFSMQRIGRLLSNPKKNYSNWLLNRSAAQKDASSFTFASSNSSSSSALTLPLLDLANDFKNILTKRELEHQEQVDLLTAKISALSTFQTPAPIQQPQHEQKSVPVSYSEKMIATIQEVKSQSKKLQAECEQLRQEKDVFSASAAQMEAEYAEAVEAGQMMAAKVQTIELKLSSCQNQVQSLQTEIVEKNRLISELQSELDEQIEYQAMVAKLAATVNKRKPGGLVGQASANAYASKSPASASKSNLEQSSMDDRKVPAKEEEERLSQVFY